MKRIHGNGHNNRLKDALSAGKRISGMKGFIHCETLECYIPVTLKRVEVEGCNTVCIAQIAGAVGEIRVSPCNFFDDRAHIKKEVADAENRKAAEEVLKRIERPHLLTQRRRQLMEYVDSLAAKERDIVYADLADNSLSFEKLTSSQVTHYAEAAIQAAFGISVQGNRYRY